MGYTAVQLSIEMRPKCVENYFERSVCELNLQQLFITCTMGGAIATRFADESTVDIGSEEYFAFKVLKAEYERTKEIVADAEAEGTTACVIDIDDPFYFHRMASIYSDALLEKDNPIEDCKCPSVVIYKYTAMSTAERNDFHTAILDSAVKKEQAIAKKYALTNKVQDYSQSFGGTAADTKNEKEAAAILRGDDVSSDQQEEENNLLYPLLAKPYVEHSFDQQQLRKYGRWGKVMGGTGCYLYLHYLTKEVVSIRPDDYIEEEAKDPLHSVPEAVKDPANGLRRIDLSEVQAEVERIVKEGKKTPLLIDNSKSGGVRAFYTYKGQLEDVSPLTVPFGKSGVKKEDVMERCRVKLVGAIKTGAVFALYLGEVRIEHADFKTKLCKKDVFPKEVFQCAGLKLLQPDYEPRYKALFREADLEAGQAIARDGFRAVVITTLDPYEYEAALAECIPLGYMEPIYVNPSD